MRTRKSNPIEVAFFYTLQAGTSFTPCHFDRREKSSLGDKPTVDRLDEEDFSLRSK
ncbi:hypothetical protein [Mucilaginibacter koreensis]